MAMRLGFVKPVPVGGETVKRTVVVHVSNVLRVGKDSVMGVV